MNDLLYNQTKAKSHLSPWRVGALFMEPGTGKTRIAIELVNASDTDAVFWIGPLGTIRPKNNIPSVIDEVNKWGGFSYPVVYTGVESIQGSDRIYLELREKIDRAKKSIYRCR